MKNAEWMIKNGYDFYGLDITQEDEETYIIWYYDDKLETINLKDSKFEVLLAWLDMKHREPILDEAEKRYLSAVIKPFRNDVLYIIKFIQFTGDEEIIVSCNYNKLNSVFIFDLPPFEKGTMYKGMEPNRRYTLEELGL